MVLAANTANVTSTTTITRTRMIFRRHFKEKSLTSCGRLGTGPNGPSADNDSRQIHWFVQCRMSIPYPNTVDQVGTCYLSTVGGRGLLRQFAIKKKEKACMLKRTVIHVLSAREATLNNPIANSQ